MAEILEKIAKTEGNENEISLQELEKHFDDITKDKKNDERQIAKLIKALEKNIDKKEQKKYAFDSKGIMHDIIDEEIDISKYDENTIKVYQLCRILEGDKDMIIDGKIGQELIYDRVELYKTQGVGLLPGESLEYDETTESLVFTTKIFDTHREIVQEPYTIIDNATNCQEFLNKKRQGAFCDFLEANNIKNRQGEAITLSDSGIMYINIIDDERDIQMEKNIDIANISDKMDIISVISEQRTVYETELAEKKKDMEERMKINNEISKEINIQDFTENLEKFGITGKTKPNWIKILTDIVTSEDISKIKVDNIGEYLPLPETVKESDKSYICLNFKSLLLQYITLFPGYTSPLLLKMEKSSTGEIQLKDTGLMTGVNLVNMDNSIAYYTSVIGCVEKLQTKGSATEKKLLAGTLDLSNPLRKDAFKLYVLNNIDGKSGTEINVFLENIFAGWTAEGLSEKGLFANANKDTIIGRLNSGYIFSKVQPYILSGKITEKNRRNTSGAEKEVGSYTMLDINAKSKYDRFIGRGNQDIDNLYVYTTKFYEQGKQLGIDASIPINDIMGFYKYFEEQNKRITDFENAKERELKENFDLYHGEDGVMMGGDGAIAGFDSNNKRIINKYSGKIYDATIALETRYVELLQLRNPKPTGKIPSLSGKVSLDFSQGPNPDDIVRNSFGENLSDQWDQFVDDLYNNRQRAFGSFTGMVGGIAGAAIAGIFTKNVWATSAGFTVGLRLGNGIGQEVWNTGEWLYESAGGEMSGTNNKVDPFGVGFMRGVGAYNDKDERVGTASFIGGLGFDYISTVATFGIGSKFAPFMEKIRGLGGLGGKVMVFGIEELFIESFLVDIPLNILQTGVYTFAGIGEGPIVGQTALGNETSSGGNKQYESGNFLDALLSMKDATEQNFSFDNLCQVFFNTVAYGGLLEGGSLGIGKIKTYMSPTEVGKFELTTKNSQDALNDMNIFLSQNNIIVDSNTQSFVDANTRLPIAETDPRIGQLTTLLQKMETLKRENLIALEELKIKQQEMIQNPKDKKGIFFRLGLINGYLTPTQMIEERMTIVDQKIQEEKDKIAKGTGDEKVLSQLEALKSEYEYAKMVLLEGDVSTESDREIEDNEGTGDITNETNLIEEMDIPIEENTVDAVSENNTSELDPWIDGNEDIDIKVEFKQEKVFFESMTAEQITEYAKNNYAEIIEKYKEKMGNVVNVDDFRDFVGGKVGIDANKTHEAASYLADTYFEDLLIQNKGKYNNTVKFLAGGAGSGKSSIDDLSPNNEYAVVLDGTFKTYKNANKNIEKAKELGYNVRVEFVMRDFNECFINGVLKRTISQNTRMLSEYGEEGLGRTVPLEIFESGHNGARNTIIELYNKYGPDVVKFYGGGDVDLSIGDGILNKMATSKGQPLYVYQYDFEYVHNKIKNDVFDRDASILSIEEAYQKGYITDQQKEDLLGKYK